MTDYTVPDLAPPWDFIASQFSVSLDSLLIANGKMPNATYLPPDAGSVIRIPDCQCVFAGPGSTVSVASGSALLQVALDGLRAQATNFGAAFINDASVRQNYVDRIAQMSEEWQNAAKSGLASWEAAASEANAVRNAIMDEARAQLSSVGTAASEAQKFSGLTLEQCLEKAVSAKFPGQTFIDLAQGNRALVFKGVVEASGRNSLKFTSIIPKMQIMGRACLVFTVAISVYNIWTAQNRTRAALHEGLVLGGGALGGALAGAATGLVCGPAAPFCSTALFIVGGIAGSMAADAADATFNDQLTELSNWLVD